MAAKSIPRVWLASPTSMSFSTSVASKAARSGVLKRPAELPLSPNPFPYQGSFNVSFAEGLLSPKSPHVHFPASANLARTYATHSPGTYDRGAIAVSPNPLEMPKWGERVFSPSTGTFNGQLAPPPQAINTPTLRLSFGTAAGLVLTPPPKAARVEKKTKASVRFRENVSKGDAKKVLPRNGMGHSHDNYPRSPYPAAKKRPAALDIGNDAFAMSADSQNEVFYSANADSAVPHSETESEKLSQDFWQSVSLSSTPAVVEDVPLSAVPRFMFGTRDGALWSPGLPRKAQPSNIESMLSPGVTRTNFAFMSENPEILSPTPLPYDPFSAFPSFAAVLSGEGVIYPERVVKPAPAELD